MIDVSDLIDDPDFCQTIIIRRQSGGEWIKGKFITTTNDLTVSGIVRPTRGEELDSIPEGDRVQGLQTFYTRENLSLAADNETTDKLIWNGNMYKVVTVFNWSRHGFYKAIGRLMGGDAIESDNGTSQ